MLVLSMNRWNKWLTIMFGNHMLDWRMDATEQMVLLEYWNWMSQTEQMIDRDVLPPYLLFL